MKRWLAYGGNLNKNNGTISLCPKSQKVMEEAAQIDAVVLFVEEAADQSHLLG
ncbi:hypothetical protein HNR34_000781 [Geobacillus subterraneus]